jgi:serine/threonine protein kinase
MQLKQVTSSILYGKNASIIPIDSNSSKAGATGWEETKGETLSKLVASQVTRIAEKKTKSLMDSQCFDRLLEDSTSTTDVDLMTHSEIELGELLGQGGFNSIYKVKSLREDSSTIHPSRKGEEYVVKVLRKEILQNKVEFALCAADIVKEGILMACLDHPHILKMRAMASSGTSSFANSRRHDSFFLVMGQLKESFEDHMDGWAKQKGRLMFSLRDRKEKKARFFVARLQVAIQLADALAYLHRYNILHRDLKPSNAGFDAHGTLKLFDFDLARVLPHDAKPGDLFNLTKKAGSLRYMSPECGIGQPYNLKSDVYSFSLLLYHIISLKEPYATLDNIEHECYVFRKRVRPTVKSSWPVQIQCLLRESWSQDIAARPSMNDVFSRLRSLHSLKAE